MKYILAILFMTGFAQAGDRIAIVYRPGLASGCNDHLDTKVLKEIRRQNPADMVGHAGVYLPKGEGSFPQLVAWVPVMERGTDPAVALRNLAKGIPTAGKWSRGKVWVERSFRQNYSPVQVFWIDLKPGDRAILLANLARLEATDIRYQFSPPDEQRFTPGAHNCVTVLPRLFEGTSIDGSFIPENGWVNHLYRNLKDRSVPVSLDEFQQWFNP